MCTLLDISEFLQMADNFLVLFGKKKSAENKNIM